MSAVAAEEEELVELVELVELEAVVGQSDMARRRPPWEEAWRARQDHIHIHINITRRGRRNDWNASANEPNENDWSERVTTTSPSSRRNSARRLTRP